MTGVERKLSRSLGAMDVTRFRIEIAAAGGEPVASIGSTWLVLRAGA